MNRPITVKTALLKISTLFLIPFFLFMLGLNVDSYLQVQQLQEKFESVMKTIDSISAFCIISPKSNITNGPFRKNVS